MRAPSGHRPHVRAETEPLDELTPSEAEKWYWDQASPKHYRAPYVSWIVEYRGHAIGTAALHMIDPVARSTRFAIGVFDQSALGRGLGTEATRLILQYAFERMRLHRVDLRVLDFNARAIAAYTKCGFVEEGRMREVLRVRGQWCDDVLMSILEHEYR